MLDHHAYRIAAWIGVAVIAAATIWQIAQADWDAVVFLALFLLAATAFILWHSRLPSLFSLLFTLAAVVNAFGWALNFWDRVPLYDPLAHAFTTFAGALAVGFLIHYSTKLHFRHHGVAFAATVAAFGLALGGLWEIFEWLMNVQQTYRSVVVDLIADTLGAVLAGILAAWAVRTQPPEQLRA